MNGSNRQLSNGRGNPGPAPAQRLSPVIEGIELRSPLRPAFQVGGDYYDFIHDPPPSISAVSGNLAWPLGDGRCDGQGCAGRPC